MIIGSLSKRVFEMRAATGSEIFFPLTCLHTATFILLNIVSLLEMFSVKIWETPLPWHAKCSLPVAVRVSKTRGLKLPINDNGNIDKDDGDPGEVDDGDKDDDVDGE